MAWDKSVPNAGSALQLGDDSIREFKTQTELALRSQANEGVESIFPGSDIANPVYRYRGLKGGDSARPDPGDYGLYFNTTSQEVQRDNGTSFDRVGVNFETGVRMIFAQASAPSGWTQVTDYDDYALRIVSGTGADTRGTKGLATSFSHEHTIPDHQHVVGAHTHSLASEWQTNGTGSNTVSGGNTHRRTENNSNFNTQATSITADSNDLGILKQIDVILCSKD